MAHTDTPVPPVAAPDAALRRLDPLVGTWALTGRTLDSAVDNISGRTTFEWLPGGFFLKCSGEITVGDFHVESLEIIGYDPASQTFSSHVYANFSGEVSAYFWDVQGELVTHWMATSKYTGSLNPDGRTLTGGWRPTSPDAEPGSAYDAVMTRV
jgi:hypothetical protein